MIYGLHMISATSKYHDKKYKVFLEMVKDQLKYNGIMEGIDNWPSFTLVD